MDTAAEPLHDWSVLSEAELRDHSAKYVGWATYDMGDPYELDWKLEQQFPVIEFHSIPTYWPSYYREEIEESPHYDQEFAEAEFHTPIIISIENDEIIIWDGWHRLACAIMREDECIIAIVGRTRGLK